MESQFPSSPILFSFLIFVFMVFRIWQKSKNNHSAPNLPPGPWKLPIIGNMHLLAGSLPHRRLRDLSSQYGPLMQLKLGELTHVVVSSTEAAREILKIHDINFAQRPRLISGRIFAYNYTDIAFSPHGDYWRQLRKVCALELLSAKRVQSFRSIREQEMSNLVTSISSKAGSPINLTKLSILFATYVTARAAFGGKCKHREAFARISEEIVHLTGMFNLAEVFPSIKLLEELGGFRSQLEKLHAEADKIFDEIIDEHRSFKRTTDEEEVDDLVHVLLNLQEKGELEFPLTTDNIKAVILDVFLGGNETSATTVQWAMSELMKNPRVMEKAQAEVRQVFGSKGNVDEAGLNELQYLKLVIKEALRLHTPIPLLLPRESRENCKILGYDIPKGCRVIVNAWAIGRDPRYWTDAESFYPERFLDSSIDFKGLNLEFIPFGAGRRICPGMNFALANLELPLANLLYHFNWKLPNGMENKDLDLDEHFGATLTRKNDLYLIPTPYHLPLAGE